MSPGAGDGFPRWLPVYIADMRLLSTLAPEVHQEFEKGNHSISRLEQPFSQVWANMALEETVNLDSKTRERIVDISKNPAALDRWFLSSHERSEVTAAIQLEAIKSQEDRGRSGMRWMSRKW